MGASCGPDALPTEKSVGIAAYVKVSNFTSINYGGFGEASREFFKCAVLWGFGRVFSEDRSRTIPLWTRKRRAA